MKNIELEIEIAKKAVDLARREVQALEDLAFRQGIKKLKGLVGTCLKYRNSYSCPQGPEDYWFAYMKLVAIKDQAWVAHEFQIDKNGELSLTKEKYVPIYSTKDPLPSGWVKISKAEYKRAYQHVLKLVASVKENGVK